MRRVNLALQGGGAHGAFTWGVLDRLLEEDDLEIAGISGTSAGALNGAALKAGRIRVFEGADLTPEALLASACLPTVFQAVTIEGETYWDGGYSGNPPLYPLYAPDLPDDIVIVSINPWLRDEVPMSPLDIQNRINEISFHAALLGELRAIKFVKRLIAEGRMERGQMKDVLLHLIADDALMTELSAGTKLSPNPGMIARLHEAGRAATDAFLSRHGADLGQRASLDLTTLLA
jgi:NTE family protein